MAYCVVGMEWHARRLPIVAHQDELISRGFNRSTLISPGLFICPARLDLAPRSRKMRKHRNVCRKFRKQTCSAFTGEMVSSTHHLICLMPALVQLHRDWHECRVVCESDPWERPVHAASVIGVVPTEHWLCRCLHQSAANPAVLER